MGNVDFTPYAQIHSSLAKHKKTYALSRVLSSRRSRVIGMLTLLWLWALDSADGYLDPDPLALADIMDWDGDPYLLEKAMIAVRFIDDFVNETTGEHQWQIHNWQLYTGEWLQKREESRQLARGRQQRHREKLKQLPLKSESITHNVTRDKDVTNALPLETEAETETLKATARDLWIKTLNIISLKVNRSNYSTWFKNTVGGNIDGNCLFVNTPTESIAIYLEKNNKTLIEMCLSEASDHKITEVDIGCNE